mmetsp:Transcript_36736/g.97064  ORF Transcript_36736/g.97064 Transcript_36736/m.97064 type:complete len:273 (+) Transcript_36736:691-1509(+)
MSFSHLTSAPSNGMSFDVSSGLAACTNSHSFSRPSCSPWDGGGGSISPPPSAITGTSTLQLGTFSLMAMQSALRFASSPERHDVSWPLHLEKPTMTCSQTEEPALLNFSSTIFRIWYVAGLSRFDITSLCSTRIASTCPSALSLLCRSAASSLRTSRAFCSSILQPAGSSWPGVSTTINSRSGSPRMCTLAKAVTLVTESLLELASKMGCLGGSSPSAGFGCQMKSKSVSLDCTYRQPAITFSSVDLPLPVHPITTSRLREGSVRVKSSMVV